MNLNTKKWIALALMMIIVGFAGMSYFNFDFRERRIVDGQSKQDASAHTERWQFTQGELQNLFVDTDFDVEVQLTSSPGANYVEVSGEMPKQLIKALQSTKIEQNTLDLKLKQSKKWELIHFGFKDEDLKIIIAMNPNEQFKEVTFTGGSSTIELKNVTGDNINITTSSGDIKGEAITATHLTVVSTSGSSSLSHIKTEEMDLRSSSGEIEVEVATGNITASAQSGEIELNQTTGLLNIKTSSGDIISEHHNGDGTFQTSSGSVSIEEQRANNLEVHTSSGDVRVSTDQAFQGTYEISTSSGEVNAPTSPGVTEDKIIIKTSSGDIRFN